MNPKLQLQILVMDINFIKEYENDHFGKVTTDLSDPEKVVNMYVYIIGEDIVHEYKEKNNLYK